MPLAVLASASRATETIGSAPNRKLPFGKHCTQAVPFKNPQQELGLPRVCGQPTNIPRLKRFMRIYENPCNSEQIFEACAAVVPVLELDVKRLLEPLGMA